MSVTGAQPFEVIPKLIKFDDLPEGSSPQTKEFFFWSSTRVMPGPGQEWWPTLHPPTLTPGTADPFLTVGAPIPLSDAELARAPMQQGQGGAPLRVLAAYRVPVTLTRKVPGQQPGTYVEPDIGPYERTIGVTTPGTPASQQVKVQANITGLVSLRSGTSVVDLGSFRGESGVKTRPQVLVSDRRDLTLEPLLGESKPAALDVTLSPSSVQGGRTYWEFVVEVKPNAVSGELPPDSVVVFKITTPTGERKLRVPVKGRAFGR